MKWNVERKHPRVRVNVPGELRCPTESFPRRAQTNTLSLGGCYVEMVETLQVNSHMDVILWLDGVKVRAWAEVVCNHPHVGNGIKFVRIADADRQKLVDFLQTAAKRSGFPFKTVSGV